MTNLALIISFLLVTLLSKSYCLPHAAKDDLPEEEQETPSLASDDDRSLTDDPIGVQMKCSQDSSDVYCQFYFTNNGENDYYLLKRNTPLEGLRSHYLTITHGHHVIKYEGRILKRAPVTKDKYVLLSAGDTISSLSINVNRAYKFPHDGLYTIQYTRPLVYLSKDRMDTLQEEQLTQESYKSFLNDVSTEIELENVYNFRKLDKEIEVGETIQMTPNWKVHITAKCPTPRYNSVAVQRQNIITPLHREMCDNNGIPKAYGVHGNSGIYKRWFGTARTSIIRGVFSAMLNGLKRSTEYSNGGTGPDHCDRPHSSDTFAYTYSNGNKVFLCKKFDSLPNVSNCPGTDSKRQTLAHEWSHAFANTDDVRIRGFSVYGGQACKDLASNNPDLAANNADNYGYFYEEYYYSW